MLKRSSLDAFRCFVKVYNITMGFSPTLYCVVESTLLQWGNPSKCHEEVLSLQPMAPPKRFDSFPLTGGCSEGLEYSIYSYSKVPAVCSIDEIVLL